MARQSFSTELRDWTNLQMQLCLSLVSPRGSTHHLYGSAPAKLYYIRLQRSSPPSSLVSHSFSPSNSWLTLNSQSRETVP